MFEACAVGELTNCLSGTEAKFIIKIDAKKHSLAISVPNMKPGLVLLMIVLPSSPNCTKLFVIGILHFICFILPSKKNFIISSQHYLLF